MDKDQRNLNFDNLKFLNRLMSTLQLRFTTVWHAGLHSLKEINSLR